MILNDLHVEQALYGLNVFVPVAGAFPRIPYGIIYFSVQFLRFSFRLAGTFAWPDSYFSILNPR